MPNSTKDGTNICMHSLILFVALISSWYYKGTVSYSVNKPSACMNMTSCTNTNVDMACGIDVEFLVDL